ncbi:MAG TPA: protoglobin domain-containing protein [Nitrospinota bacterium]|nr:protoglobin domain-containing protein [Nitrospinota bacterium]
MAIAIDRVKENYSFTEWDVKVLLRLASVMEKHTDDFADEFYSKIKMFKNASKYLNSEKIIENHRDAIKGWFLKLFQGPFDDDYLYFLERIGYTHVKIDLPSHYVNVSINFIRNYCLEIIIKEVPQTQERADMVVSLGKILDINLDILTSSYIQEEKNIFFISKKAEGKLINFAKRFSYGLNLVLLFGLVILGITVLGLFAFDLTHLFSGNIEKGLLASLGSLLMLWVVIELVDTEVDHLKGSKFSIKIFVSVAMVAIIRKILISSLKSDEVNAQMFLLVALAVLGAIFWIISKTEKLEE